MINFNEIVLPGIPRRFESFTFPVNMDETAMHADEDFYDWFFEHAEIVKTLFKYTKDPIPEITYIAEYENAYFLLTPDIPGVEGRFPSINDVLEFTNYDEIGRSPLADIDYIRVFKLDREPDDADLDYIVHNSLFEWFKENGEFCSRFLIDERLTETYCYDIYQLCGGFFILDPFENSIIGKYSSEEEVFRQTPNAYFEYFED